MSILRYPVSIVLDFIRWSQMAPMILAWAFLLITLAVMTITSFQQTSFTFFEWLAGVWGRYDWLPDWNTAAYEQTDGSMHITDEQLRPAILKAWGVLSLALLVIDLLRTSLFGPSPPRPLSRSLLITAIACLAVSIGFMLNYWFNTETFNGGAMGWMALFIGGPAMVWLISAYSLSVNRALGHINDKLLNSHDDSGRTASY